MIRHRHDAEADEEWESGARAALGRFAHLDAEARARSLRHAREVDRRWAWEALDGIELTNGMRASIAAPACVLTANIGLDWFNDVSAVLVEPSSTRRSMRHDVGGGIISESAGHVLGQALVHGPVRIAWDQVQRDRNALLPKSVILHEFAHKIDMFDGVVDGVPAVGRRSDVQAFQSVLDVTLDDLRNGRHDGPLRAYGATNRPEFFAVATETFFLAGSELAESAGALYEALATFYRQDPASAGTG